MRIGLVGTFDINNYGDCLFPEVWAHILRERFGQIDITLLSPTARAAEILSFEKVVALPDTFGSRLLAANGERFDALILTGGQTLGIGHGSGTYIFPKRTFSHLLRLWLAPLLEAARSRQECAPGQQTKFIAHSVGLTPLPVERERLMSPVLASADRVTLRDTFSAERLERALPPAMRNRNVYDICADPMYLLDRLLAPADWAALARRGLPGDLDPDRYIVAQISHSYVSGDGFDAFADAVSQVAHKMSADVLLLPVCHFLHDGLVLDGVRARLEARGVRCARGRNLANVKETAALISRAQAVMCSSLHAALTSLVFRKPMAILSHSLKGKHQGTLARVGLTNAVTTEIRCLPAVLEATSRLDLDSIAREAARQAEEGLAPTLEALEAPVAHDSLPGLDAIESAARALIDYERENAVGGPAEFLRRAIFLAAGWIPGLRRCYDHFKLRRRLRIVQ